MLVDCSHMVEDIVKLLVQPGSHISHFLTPYADTQFQGDAKYTGSVENLLFSTEITVYLGKQYEIGP